MAETDPSEDTLRAGSTSEVHNVGQPQEQLQSGPSEDAIQTPSTNDADNVGHPQEQLEVDEGGTSEENIVYPSGPKLWLTMGSLCLACFLNGLVGSYALDLESPMNQRLTH